MRTPYAAALLLTMLLAGTYWYTSVGAVCRTPVSYHIGQIDPRFGISKEEVRNVIEEAASIWENATDRNLFTYDESSEIAVNFVYDERQYNADQAERLKEQLDKQKDINDTLSDTYAALVSKYNERKLVFEDKKAAYERKLNEYNSEVESYNQSGGAPPDVYAELEERRKALDVEQREVNEMAGELNDLSAEINKLGEQGNEIVDKYNESVSDFNQNYGHSEEFTQGDYQGDRINIYKFESRAELELVLAHELGHALSIGHVDNDTAIMYYLMGDQPIDDISLTTEDLAGFELVCGEVSLTEHLRRLIQQWSDWLRP